MFRWAVAQEFCPPQIVTALDAIDGLRTGRSAAIESDDVPPVALEAVEAVEPFVSRPVWGSIRFQLATACRLGEAILTRGRDADCGCATWTSTGARL